MQPRAIFLIPTILHLIVALGRLSVTRASCRWPFSMKILYVYSSAPRRRYEIVLASNIPGAGSPMSFPGGGFLLIVANVKPYTFDKIELDVNKRGPAA